MATRSRRSGASGEAPALNPTMIHLLDTGRLKKELELRGLATTGSKTMLADRLAEAVVLGKVYDEAVNTPVSPVKTRAPRKKSIVAPVAVKSEPNISSADDSLVEVHSSRRTLTKAKQSRRKSIKTDTVDEQVEQPIETSNSFNTAAEPTRSKQRNSSNLNPSSAKRRKISASCIKEEVVSTESDEDAPLSKVISKKPELRKESSTDNQLFASPTVDQVSSVSMTVAPELGRNLSDEDEDVPLLSLLGPKKNEETQHHHGTRSKKRAEILVDSVPVVRKRAFEETNILRNTDFSVDIPSPSNMTPCGSGPSSPSKLKTDYERRAEKVMKREKRASASEKDRPATLLERRSSTATEKSRTRVTERKTITDLWAEKLAELKKNQASEQLPSITLEKDGNERIAEVVVKLESGEETDGKTTKSPETSRKLDERKATVLAKKISIKADTDDLLGSILVDQSELLKNTKKNMEDEEMLERELAEQRRGQLTTIRNSIPITSSASITLLPPPPPPPPPPKRTIPIALPVPPPPPPKRTVLEPQLISSRSPISTLPPPPPPPKLNAMSVPRPNPKMLVPSSTRSASGRSLPPPPPRGPKPVRVVLEAEKRRSKHNSREGSGQGSSRSSQPVTPSVSHESTSPDGSQLVDCVTLALLKVLEQRKRQEVEREVRECVDVLITLVENIQPHNYELNEDSSSFDITRPNLQSEATKKSSNEVVQLEKADEPQIDTEMLKTGPEDQKEEEEEYDPLDATTICDFEEYIPSAVGTRNCTVDESQLEFLDDEEYEVDGEGVESDDEEENSEKNEETDGCVSSRSISRAAAGKEDKPDVADLLKDPRHLLARATVVLQSLNNPQPTSISPSSSTHQLQYSQVVPEEEYEPEETEKPMPEFHGEPVPSDDDDMLFEIAAGLTKPKKKKEVVIEEERLPSDETIEPDYYNADLHIKGALEKNWMVEPENADGLALMWGGVKSNYGIRLPFRDVTKPSGDETNLQKISIRSTKIVFQIKIMEFLSTKHLPFEEMDPHDVRVGFSLRTAPNILGEYMSSYCYTSLGRKASNNVFSDYGEPFHQDDVITSVIDIAEHTISFWKNDTCLGVAFRDVRLPDGDAVYPHICIKNCRVAVNFGEFPEGETMWKSNPEWRFPSSLGRGDLERSIAPPDSKANCTVLMMVGLPGVGKTTWVRQYLRDHPTEQWTVVNVEGIMNAMKVNGISRKRAHQGRWDMVMGLVGKSIQRSIMLAARRRRNYILDMSNVARDTRKRRLQMFEEFQRKCVVIIPSDEDMLDRQSRQARQEGTAIMPPEAMLEMKAVISIPAPDQEPLEEVYFIEPPIHRIQDAIELVARYNEEARPWYQKKYKRRRAQNIGLGPDREPRRSAAPLTVLPTLKVSITPIGVCTETTESATTPKVSTTADDNSPARTPTGTTTTPAVSGPDLSRPPPAISVPDLSQPPPGILVASNVAPTAVFPIPPASVSSQSPVVLNFTEPPPSTIRGGEPTYSFAKNLPIQSNALEESSSYETSTDFVPLPNDNVLWGGVESGVSNLVTNTADQSIPLPTTLSFVVDTSRPPPSLSLPTTNELLQPPPGIPVPLSSPLIDVSRPPPSAVPVRPLVSVKIEDLPPVEPVISAAPVLYKKGSSPLVRILSLTVAQPLDDDFKPDADLLNELREEAQAASSNPIVAEAILRAKVKALQLKKRDKKDKLPSSTVDPSIATSIVPLGPQIPQSQVDVVERNTSAVTLPNIVPEGSSRTMPPYQSHMF